MNPNGETQDPTKAPPEAGVMSPELAAQLEAASVQQAQEAIADIAQAASEQGAIGKDFDKDLRPPPPLPVVDRGDNPMVRLARVEVVLAKVLEHMSTSITSPVSRVDAEELMEYLRAGDPTITDE